MKLVVFGLTVSSSWGNGHATLWRGLQRALAARGWRVVFFERDQPYYAVARDLHELPDGELVLYSDWRNIRRQAKSHISEADVALVTSFCPDGVEATREVLAAQRALRVFYDLDTPVTLDLLQRGEELTYIGENGLKEFDLVFSYTGGSVLNEVRDRLGARRVVPLYGHADPAVYRPCPKQPNFVSDLSYLGTYAQDRQAALEQLFLEPARRLPASRFTIAGAQYPQDFPWRDNIHFVRHLAPQSHPAFFSSSKLTLNVTRPSMARAGWCPSGRLFEAALCGAPIISDRWRGLDDFFEIGKEILVADGADDVVGALCRNPEELGRVGAAARERASESHTAARRAMQFEAALNEARTGELKELAQS